MAFRVSSSDIPDTIKVHLGLKNREMFADLLTKWGIPAEHAGDTFEHILKKGLEQKYKEHFGE